MKKRALQLLLSIFFLLFQAFPVNASLLAIGKDGKIVWNVLSEEASLEIPKHSYMEVKEVVEKKADEGSVVALVKGENGKMNLTVTSLGGLRELDVTGYKSDLVEIEERAPIQKLSLKLEGDKIVLVQRGVRAKTDYAVSVDAKTAEIIVKTPSGSKYVSILPQEAVETILRTKIINRVASGEINIVEEERELLYKISGEKVVHLLNVYDYNIPVSANLSASTGEVLSIEAPIWYKLIVFLLT